MAPRLTVPSAGRAGLERRAGSWGRTPSLLSPKLPRAASMSGWKTSVWVVLRGFVFVPGALMGLALAFVLAHGFNAVLVYAHLLWVPRRSSAGSRPPAARAATAGRRASWPSGPELGLMRIGSWII